MTRRWLAVALVVAAAIGAGVFGWRAYHHGADTPVAATEVPDTDDDIGNGVETVSTGDQAIDETGTTPMAERVAVLGLLNKRNGESREITMRPGGAVRIGDVVVRLRACEHGAPWEDEPLTGAFVQLDARGADQHWRRWFSGWLYKERPALNVVQHPVYDVWTKSCTMSWPDKGPDTETLAPSAPDRSSAKKSPDDAALGDGSAPIAPDSAAPSNAT